MARNRKRQANGSPWHRRFDNGWYATIDGVRTKLCGEAGRPIRGKDLREQAELAVARLKLQLPMVTPGDGILVATVIDAYLEHLKASASSQYVELATHTMNDFCSYCGGLPVSYLKKKYVQDWVGPPIRPGNMTTPNATTWRSSLPLLTMP